jgi:hypothetical protein
MQMRRAFVLGPAPGADDPGVTALDSRD